MSAGEVVTAPTPTWLDDMAVLLELGSCKRLLLEQTQLHIRRFADDRS